MNTIRPMKKSDHKMVRVKKEKIAPKQHLINNLNKEQMRLIVSEVVSGVDFSKHPKEKLLPLIQELPYEKMVKILKKHGKGKSPNK